MRHCDTKKLSLNILPGESIVLIDNAFIISNANIIINVQKFFHVILMVKIIL